MWYIQKEIYQVLGKNGCVKNWQWITYKIQFVGPGKSKAKESEFMKKIMAITLITIMSLSLSGCSQKEPSVVKQYEVTDPELVDENGDKDELVTMVKYYEMSDGTWKTDDDHTYQYRLEITGRMSNEAKDSTFVFLSNTKDITFEQAWKASGFSSNMNDYFKEEDSKLVAMK